jgi:YgiT-type zinc finger domain-containing protein
MTDDWRISYKVGNNDFGSLKKSMNCVICKHGILSEGHTTLTLERDGVVVVFKQVPAQVCDTCGEAYIDEAVSHRLLIAADETVRAGAEVEVRRYAAA